MSTEIVLCIFVIGAIAISIMFTMIQQYEREKEQDKKVIQRKPNTFSTISKNDDQNHLNKMINLLRKVLIEGIENRSIIVGNSEYVSIISELDSYTKKRDELKNRKSNCSPTNQTSKDINDTDDTNAISATKQLIK